MMRDNHIDDLESLDYGDHFVEQVDDLAGKTTLVDIASLKAYVGAATTAVATELEKQGIKRSSVRVNRQDVATKSTALRKQLEKFHNYLGSLDDDQGYDLEAFFKEGNLGPISTLKPADLAQYAGQVMRGFNAEANSSLPEAAKWKTRLGDAQYALATALTNKSTSTGQTIQGTAALVAAREAFLAAYNGVAKRLVQGVLIQLNRKDDLRLYFKDLQVNEASLGTPAPASPAPDTSTNPNP